MAGSGRSAFGRRRAHAALALIIATLLAAAVQAADSIRVQPLARGGRVLVSFTIGAGVDQETTDAIRSGLAMSFVYDVELRRGTPLWFDRTIDQAVVTATVQYDNLRRTHQLSRSVNGRMEPDVLVTEDVEVVRQWITTFSQLPLFSTAALEPNAEYYVRVRARAHPRNSLFLWPWGGSGGSGFAKFTFIP
jgi:uncharacterized protein DUF4390